MRGNRGFTLLELLVALSIGALVLTIAHRLVAGVTAGAAQLDEVVDGADRDANAARLLIALLGSAQVLDGLEDAFRGEPTELAFPAWDVDHRGWPVKRDIGLQRAGDGVVWLRRGNDSLAVWRGVRALDLDYLLTRGASARWVRAWVSSASVPYAVRLRLRRETEVDTLLCLVGDRG
jgi:prepilin-type N-terminal cleavage/methylation domain-containing protein